MYCILTWSCKDGSIFFCFFFFLREVVTAAGVRGREGVDGIWSWDEE